MNEFKFWLNDTHDLKLLLDDIENMQEEIHQILYSKSIIKKIFWFPKALRLTGCVGKKLEIARGKLKCL